MEEIWRDIKGYEGCYQVSNLGNVKSLERVVNCGSKTRVIEEKILSTRNTGGYPHVVLCKGNKIKSNYIHRLVAEAFLPNDNNYLEVDHIDTNKANNNVSNLRWVTKTQNQNNELTLLHLKESCNVEGLKKRVVRLNEQGILINVFDSISDAARETKCSISGITRCCKLNKNIAEHKSGNKFWMYYDDFSRMKNKGKAKESDEQ